MHRLTGKTYSNGDPSVTYSYDQTNCLGLAACYNKGHRTGMTDAAGSESWAYDLMGRAVKEQRVTNGVTKTTTYTYYMDGSVASIVYPSGRTITYGYDAVTRPVSAVDSANSINYVTAALYSPAGGLASLQNGAALISKFFYNKRLQPCRISVKNTGTSPSQCSDAVNLGNILDFTYDYNLGTANNGEVKQIANNRNPSRTQNFTYDSLNRILTASTQATTGTYAWGLQFGYDIWGNLLTSTLTQGSAPILSVSADTNNRISGFCYDAAGNLLAQSAPPCPSPTYTYDAENRIKATAGVTYTYDGDGNRVKKSNGKLYWYGSGSVILDESDATGNVTNEYIFFGGKRLARRVVSSGQIQYYFADHLGSSRVVTDASGIILDDADFYPFGGERTYSSSSGNAYKFTGKERDTESGLDNLGARYFTSQFGRFMTPDWSASPVLVPYADLGNPQTFNLYSYVANNPLNGVDPEGHFRLDPGTQNYNDPDTGKPLYGEAVTPEQAQNTATQQAHLSAADVTKIVLQALESKADAVSTGIQIFNNLGNNVSVTGDALRQGVAEAEKQTGKKLEGAPADLISHADSITKSGSSVTITSQKGFDTKIGDVKLGISKTVSFTVGTEKGLPFLSNINGVSPGFGKLSGIDRIGIITKGEQKFVHTNYHIGWKHSERDDPLP